MIRAENVRPQTWSEIEILFENEAHSIIWGKNSNNKTLGMRWNGAETATSVGYPHRDGKYPLWYNVPDFIADAILLELLKLEDVAVKKDKVLLAIQQIENEERKKKFATILNDLKTKM